MFSIFVKWQEGHYAVSEGNEVREEGNPIG